MNNPKTSKKLDKEAQKARDAYDNYTMPTPYLGVKVGIVLWAIFTTIAILTH